MNDSHTLTLEIDRLTASLAAKDAQIEGLMAALESIAEYDTKVCDSDQGPLTNIRRGKFARIALRALAALAEK